MSAARYVTRALERADLPAVVRLQRASFPGTRARAEAEMLRKATELFVDGPLRDPESPPLVACDEEGRVVGFRGIVYRGWRLGAEPLVARLVTGLVVDPALRRRGVARALRETGRALRSGAFGFSDRLTTEGLHFSQTGNSWRLEAYGFPWTLPLRPRAARLLRLAERAERRASGGAARGLRSAARTAARALPERAPAAPEGPALRVVPLEAEALREAQAALAEAGPLALDEPLETVRWQLAYLADYPSRGAFEGRVLLDTGGAPAGFFAGYRRAADSFELLALGARPCAFAGVLGRAAEHAFARGAVSLRGTAGLGELRTLLEAGAALRAGLPCTLRSERADLAHLFETGRARVTGLESERWV